MHIGRHSPDVHKDINFDFRCAADRKSIILLSGRSELKMSNKVLKNRILVWNDEFDGEKLDLNKWEFSQSMSNSDVLYDNGEKNFRIDNGTLLMRVNRTDSSEKPFTLSQGLTTKNKMGFRYGYLEMRAAVPFRHGAWPSFWAMSFPRLHSRDIGWGAEVDIFEVFSNENTLFPNLHKHGPNREHFMIQDEQNPNRSGGYRFADDKNPNDFHIYGFEWTKEHMSFFVDGECYHTYNLDDECEFAKTALKGLEGYREHLYLLINNEIFTENSGWKPVGSALNDSDTLPIEYRIDYIRLYQDPENESIFTVGEE